MVEREKGTPPERRPETVEEVSGRLQKLFENVKEEHPKELFIWQSALYDIIDQAQVQYNVRVLKERALENTPGASERYDEESRYQTYKDKRILNKLNTDDNYNQSYERISGEMYAMETAFIRNGTINHLGATIREFRRVKRSVQEL